MAWNRLLNDHDFEGIAQKIIDEAEGLDWGEVREDPFGTVENYSGVTVSFQDRLGDSCGGGGYYDHGSRVIYIHPTYGRRDNFTLLHELGHHLQRLNEGWAMATLLMQRNDRIRIEEMVSNELAGRVLLPIASDDLDRSNILPADYMAVQHRLSKASFAAVVRRVRELLKKQDTHWLLAVSNLDGEVIASQTTYQDFPPARGSIQQGLAALASEAKEGPVRRTFWEGIIYSDGGRLVDLEAHAVLSEDGSRLFAAFHPISLGGVGARESAEYECAREACGTTFGGGKVKQWCESCAGPKCPACRDCSCEFVQDAVQCSHCFMPVRQIELDTGTHDCY